VAPGISSIMAAELAARFDKTGHIAIRFLEDQQASEVLFPWAAEIALADCFCPSLSWFHTGAAGRFRRHVPLIAPEKVRFSGGLGTFETVRIYGEEVLTVARYIDCKSVDVKSGGSDIDAVRELWAGMPNQKKWKSWLKAQKFKTSGPRDLLSAFKRGTLRNAHFAIAVMVQGRRGGRRETLRMDAVFPDFKAITRRMPGASYIGWPTGLAAALFAEQCPLGPAGVYPPEALASPLRRRVLAALKPYGVVLSRRKVAA
jgi:hypothetical protein